MDDLILTGDDYTHINFVKQKLCETFFMTDLRPLRYFLGIEVTSNSEVYKLPQHRYILDLLAGPGLTDTCTVATPMELHLQLRASMGPLSDPTRYRHLVGSLVYLAVTRPVISHAVMFLVSLSRLPLPCIMVIFFVCYDISGGLLPVVSFTLVGPLFSFRPLRCYLGELPR